MVAAGGGVDFGVWESDESKCDETEKIHNIFLCLIKETYCY